VTTINRFLTASEAAYIVRDSGSRAVVASGALSDIAKAVRLMVSECELWLMTDEVVEGFTEYEATIAGSSDQPFDDEPMGDLFLYSSGTTGQPKGISRPLPNEQIAAGMGIAHMSEVLFGLTKDAVYLSTAPLYHSAPLGMALSTQALGGTVVVMESFDAERALELIERYGVTHSQWVPTMFTRMLRLPDEVRARHDLSSMGFAVHTSAPCPRTTKQAMLDWWGPIIHEYYGGTEANGLTYVGPEDWLSHPGTVGKPVLGSVHICDDAGRELPAGQEGMVYFELPALPFHYHHAPEKTRDVVHPNHPTWSRLGDVGRLDDDGFLYLTDRATFMIVSGGSNIYPQEIEDCLVMHPKVADVAVFGVPDDDMGEAVKAVVEPINGLTGSPELEAELIEYSRAHISHYKCPRTIDFMDELPRLPTGKLYKRVLRHPYWEGRESRV
jgi:fatty-acyl-CoA synthase